MANAELRRRICAATKSRNCWSIDSRTVTKVGGEPYRVLANAVGVWAASLRNGSVTRLDPVDGAVLERVKVDGYPYALAYDQRGIWVAAQTSIYRLDPMKLTQKGVVHPPF
jgi:streptogramin lyase